MFLQQEQNSRKPCLLYIEDNAANVNLVLEIVERRGNLKFLSANSGHKGFEMAREHLPDVILMDIKLPDISGIEVLGLLRANTATAAIPVMALSSNAYPRQIEHGETAGFQKYLTKPFRINDFLDALDSCLLIAARARQ